MGSKNLHLGSWVLLSDKGVKGDHFSGKFVKKIAPRRPSQHFTENSKQSKFNYLITQGRSSHPHLKVDERMTKLVLN